MPDLIPIHVSLQHRAGPLDLDVQFILEQPWTALFAPSGAGKTTILRMIAGLDAPQAGRIRAGGIQAESGAVLLDTRKRIAVAPHRRGMRMVAQRPALFPHRSVVENVRYGAAVDSNGLIAPLQALMELCRIPHLRDKMPSSLSGGERQRVALARALAASPGTLLLLLDEPFTGLEADLRDHLIRDLRAWTREHALPVLLVTHDLGEVFAAEAEVLKMEGGRIVASGSAREVLAAERERLLLRLGR